MKFDRNTGELRQMEFRDMLDDKLLTAGAPNSRTTGELAVIL